MFKKSKFLSLKLNLGKTLLSLSLFFVSTFEKISYTIRNVSLWLQLQEGAIRMLPPQSIFCNDLSVQMPYKQKPLEVVYKMFNLIQTMGYVGLTCNPQDSSSPFLIRIFTLVQNHNIGMLLGFTVYFVPNSVTFAFLKFTDMK